jgi:acetyl esterase/lipase
MLIAFLVLQIVTTPSPTFVNARFPVRVNHDIEYGRAPVRSAPASDKRLLLDLYQPDGDSIPGLRPGFVAVHGGGLTRGDKRTENMLELCRELARRGYVCASINYRLRGDDPPAEGDTPLARTLNAAIDDAALAVDWLRSNAARFRIDPARIAVGGSSAGAEIVLRMVYRDRRPEPPVAAVLSWVGGLNGREGILDAGQPPLFIVNGAVDSLVPAAEAYALAERAHRVGIPYEVYVCEGLGHNVPLDRRPSGVSLYHRLVTFLHRHLDLSHLGRELRKPGQQRTESVYSPRSLGCPR